MTKAECEKIIGMLLEDIADVYRQFNPDLKHLSMYIMRDDIFHEERMSAFDIDEDTQEYTFNFYSERKIEEADSDDADR